MRLTSATLACAVFCLAASAAEKTEIGELNGAAFRIDVPADWNGSLVLYCHGYSPVAEQFKPEKAQPVEQVFLDAGFAVAMSGYSSGGWAVREAEIDSLALKSYFAQKYGKPKQVYVTGHSMGGLMTVLLAERYPTDFVGAMPMCGVIEPTLIAQHAAFDSHAVFDYLLAGALPTVREIPDSFHYSDELVKDVTAKLEANPKALAALESYTGLKSAKDIAGAMTFLTGLFQELYRRAGGNPFDNRSTIYTGTGDDNALNAGVKRYASDPQAVDYLRAYYTPTGRLIHPMLAIHTTYDTLVPPRVPNAYAERTVMAGSGDLFVQQYVPNDGHCAITPEETATGFAELRAWVDSGKRPDGGAVPEK